MGAAASSAAVCVVLVANRPPACRPTPSGFCSPLPSPGSLIQHRTVDPLTPMSAHPGSAYPLLQTPTPSITPQRTQVGASALGEMVLPQLRSRYSNMASMRDPALPACSAVSLALQSAHHLNTRVAPNAPTKADTTANSPLREGITHSNPRSGPSPPPLYRHSLTTGNALDCIPFFSAINSRPNNHAPLYPRFCFARRCETSRPPRASLYPTWPLCPPLQFTVKNSCSFTFHLQPSFSSSSSLARSGPPFSPISTSGPPFQTWLAARRVRILGPPPALRST